MSKFIFDNKDKLNSYTKQPEKDIKLAKTNKFYLSNKCLQYLSENNRESYKEIGRKYSEDLQPFIPEKYPNDYALLNNCYINSLGVIITEKSDVLVNGGCKCNEREITYSNLNLINYKSVVSISAKWTEGIWHFPFEALVALKCIPKHILTSSKIHVTQKNNYIIQWLNLLGIKEDRVISGNIIADKLYLPRMGKCGNPYYSQIRWLRDLVYKPQENLEYVIIVKRNFRRSSQNFKELLEEITSFTKSKNLKLYIHDDTKLPSLVEQQNIFSKAKYVFAEHGAAGIHMISMNKNAYYIEFLNSDINICYSRLAYLLDINYIGISSTNKISNLKNIYKML